MSHTFHVYFTFILWHCVWADFFLKKPLTAFFMFIRKRKTVFCTFNYISLHPLHLNYNFADQETAQSRNLSQSPNPDLVLGPRLRGQSPGRSPNPKPSLPRSEFN